MQCHLSSPENRDILSKKQHQILRRTEEVITANKRLRDAALASPLFPVADSVFRLTFAHLGPGHYAKGIHFDWHKHSDYQVEVVLSGEFHFATRNHSVVLAPGDILLIVPQIEHRWRTPVGGIMLGADLHRTLLARKLGVLSDRPGDAEPGGIAIERASSAVTVLGDAIANVRHSDLDRIALEAGLAALVAAVLSSHFSPPPAVAEKCDDIERGYAIETVERTCRFLLDNIARRITHDDLQKLTGMTPRHLNRLFRQHVGRSVHQFTIDARLLRAEEMIRAGSHFQVKEIAYECGFSSTTHLSSTMKKRLGVLPSEWAEALAKRVTRE